jgi:hypothetical protein
LSHSPVANGIDQLHPHIDNAIVGVGEQNHVEAVVGEVLDDAIAAIDATVMADALDSSLVARCRAYVVRISHLASDGHTGNHPRQKSASKRSSPRDPHGIDVWVRHRLEAWCEPRG